MEGKDGRTKMLSCAARGPGPVYKLRTLIGYDDHCASKHRSPAYSMRRRTGRAVESVGPGPRYNIEYMTKYGLEKPPAYTIGSRAALKLRATGPGPGAYSPEKCPPMNHSVRAAAYSIKRRDRGKYSDDGPGPVYLLPSCIGPRIPDKTALGAFSIAGRHERDYLDDGPGPAAYADKNYDLIKRRLPAYSVSARLKGFENSSVGPGPQYYPRYFGGKQQPVYSFGIRHSECAGTPITEQDDE